MDTPWRSFTRGHTLIELTIVLVILGLLSIGARAVMANRADFSGSLVKDQLIASVRLAQLNALSKTISNGVSHTLSTAGNELVFNVTHASNVSSRRVNSEGTSVTWSTGSLTGSCAGVTGSLPHTLSFDSAGDTTQTRYCVTGVRTYAVCVSSLGFAYEGDCDV